MPRGGSKPRDPLARFWAKIDKTETCWLWTAAIDAWGYGRFWTTDGKMHQAHRWLYESERGPVEGRAHLDHLCRNPACVRPDHLEPVPCRVNLMRGETLAAANVRKTHCPQGHPYDEANTARKAGNRRSCRACARDYARRRYHERANAR